MKKTPEKKHFSSIFHSKIIFFCP